MGLVQDKLAQVNPLGGSAQVLSQLQSEQAAATPTGQGGATTLQQDMARADAESAALREDQARLEREHSRISTVATQGARGLMDALLGSGALLGAGIEGAGTLVGSNTVRDFGRDLGTASSGKSAAEAAAFLFGGGGQEGLSAAEQTHRDIDEQERAHPMLSTVSRLAGQATLALAGGELAATSKGVALIGGLALEGAGAGAQGAYENAAPLRDVLTSTLLGAALGAGGGAASEYVGGALARRATARAASAEEGELLSRVFGKVDDLGSSAVTAERAGGRESQGVLLELERARDEVVEAARSAGQNGTVAAEAAEQATQKVSRELAEKAGHYDPATVLEQAPTSLQKVVYRAQILDEASSRLSEAVSATSAARPGLDFDLSAKALSKLTKDADATDAIGGLQAAVRRAAEEAPATAAGDQAGRLLRQSSTILDSAEAPAAMGQGHALARQLLSVAESAPDAATKDYASRTARAVMDELGGDQWGKAGAYYRELTAPPTNAFEKMADAKVLRAGLANAEYRGALGQAVTAEAKAIALAHDARLKLSGAPLAREERRAIASQLSGLEEAFSRAEEATTVDGGSAGKVLDWFKDRIEDKVLGTLGGAAGGVVGGIPGAALGYVVSNAIRPAIKKVLPALLDAGSRGLESAASPIASGIGRAGPALSRAPAKALSPDEEQDQYRRRMDTAFAVQSATELPAVTAGVSRIGLPDGALGTVAADYRLKMQNYLQEVPKPQPSIKGKAWETLSSEQVRLANAMWEATVDPLSVFSDFARGDVDYDKVQYAWRQYPGLQQAAQAGFADEITGMSDEERSSLPDGVIGQVDFLLGYGGTLEPTLDRGFSTRMDQVGAQARAQQQGPPQGGQLSTPEAKPTFAQRLAAGPRS